MPWKITMEAFEYEFIRNYKGYTVRRHVTSGKYSLGKVNHPHSLKRFNFIAEVLNYVERHAKDIHAQ